MHFRARPERRTKIMLDLRQVEKMDIKLHSKLDEQNYAIPGVPDWYNKIYKRTGSEMNPFTVTCNCEQFAAKSQKHPPRDARSLCRHLVQFYKQKLNFPELTLGILFAEAAFKSDALHLVRYENEAESFWFSFVETSVWVQVYIPGAAWSHASYDCKMKRWAYGLPPENSTAIEKIIGEQFTINSKPLPAQNE